MVIAALKRGELKLSPMGGRIGIRRKDFLNWINNENPVRRDLETKIQR
jgi:hypothetical protein